MPRPLIAVRKLIAPDFFAMAEIDPDKVRALVEHLRMGGKVPPVVTALYGSKAMPLDGHHRMDAHRILGRQVDAWTVPGRSFDRICAEHRNAEELVICGGVPAMKVASVWCENSSDDAPRLRPGR